MQFCRISLPKSTTSPVTQLVLCYLLFVPFVRSLQRKVWTAKSLHLVFAASTRAVVQKHCLCLDSLCKYVGLVHLCTKFTVMGDAQHSIPLFWFCGKSFSLLVIFFVIVLPFCDVYFDVP